MLCFVYKSHSSPCSYCSRLLKVNCKEPIATYCLLGDGKELTYDFLIKQNLSELIKPCLIFCNIYILVKQTRTLAYLWVWY
jgi:hypothetical protein